MVRHFRCRSRYVSHLPRFSHLHPCLTIPAPSPNPADPSTWSVEDTKSYLQDKGVKVPEGYSKDELVALVKQNLDGAAKAGAQGAGVAQAYYEAYTEKAIDA
jgi:hypothetical protein